MRGSLSELSGFGISAKTRETTTAPVSTLSVNAKKLKIQHLTADKPDFNLAALFEACSDYFVVRPSQLPSDDEKLARYLANVTYAVRSSIACGRFSGLVVLDETDRYIGSYGRSFFAESTSVWAVPKSADPMPVKELAERITSMTVFGASLRYPRERITPGEGFEAALHADSTIAEAFDVFKTLDVDFLVLTDSVGRFKGIVRYRDVMEEVIGALIKE